MHEDHLFLAVVADLEGSVAGARDEYTLIKSSALLRQLLLDREPLARRLGRTYGVSLRFPVPTHDATTSLGVEGESMRWVSPAAPVGNSRSVTLDQFLRYRMLQFDGETYSVRNIIKCVAHAFGGVHLFDPEDEREERLMRANRDLQVNDVGLLLESLVPISESVMVGLERLVAAVRTGP